MLGTMDAVTLTRKDQVVVEVVHLSHRIPGVGELQGWRDDMPLCCLPFVEQHPVYILRDAPEDQVDHLDRAVWVGRATLGTQANLLDVVVTSDAGTVVRLVPLVSFVSPEERQKLFFMLSHAPAPSTQHPQRDRRASKRTKYDERTKYDDAVREGEVLSNARLQSVVVGGKEKQGGDDKRGKEKQGKEKQDKPEKGYYAVNPWRGQFLLVSQSDGTVLQRGLFNESSHTSEGQSFFSAYKDHEVDGFYLRNETSPCATLTLSELCSISNELACIRAPLTAVTEVDLPLSATALSYFLP